MQELQDEHALAEHAKRSSAALPTRDARTNHAVSSNFCPASSYVSPTNEDGSDAHAQRPGNVALVEVSRSLAARAALAGGVAAAARALPERRAWLGRPGDGSWLWVAALGRLA